MTEKVFSYLNFTDPTKPHSDKDERVCSSTERDFHQLLLVIDVNFYACFIHVLLIRRLPSHHIIPLATREAKNSRLASFQLHNFIITPIIGKV